MAEAWKARWQNTNSIEDVYDAGLDLGFYEDRINYYWGYDFYLLTAARHLRQAGNFKAAHAALTLREFSSPGASPLPEVWLRRIAEEKRLLKARSRK